jgi:hypothetical protein
VPDPLLAPSPLQRWLRLAVALAALALFVRFIAPVPIEYIGPWKEYAAVVRQTGINPGALYYTDIDQSTEAEMHNRDSLRYRSAPR